jgi:hypothetical protein
MMAPVFTQVTLGASATLAALLRALNPTVAMVPALRRYLTLRAQTTGGYMAIGAAASSSTRPMYTDSIQFDMLAEDVSDLRLFGTGQVVDVVMSASK